MGEWRTRALSDLISLQRGYDLPAETRTAGTVPVVGSGGISGWHNEAREEGPGVVVGRAGASIGKPTLAKGPYWPLNTTLFVKDFKGNNPRWVYYLFEITDFTGFNSGGAQPMLNRNYIAGLQVRTPDISEQVAIAEVLGALDDKIAANTRALRLSVELSDTKFAQAVKGVQLGDETFGDLAEVNGGGTPKTSVDEYWNGEISWATPTDVTDLPGPYLFSTNRTVTQAGLNSCASMLYPEGSILMTSRATVGAFAIAKCPTAVNQGFIVVNARDPRYQLWILHEMRARVPEFLNYANGATFLELGRGKFKQLRVRIPSVEVAQRFSREVESLHEFASLMIIESTKAANVRDELLPLLMSGKIHVREAEKVVEGVV